MCSGILHSDVKKQVTARTMGSLITEVCPEKHKPCYSKDSPIYTIIKTGKQYVVGCRRG